MRKTLTISLPEEVRSELDRVASEEGVSRSDIVRESLRDYLFLRRSQVIRTRLLPQAAEQGIFTDEDVFDRVS
jgi:metal-responsive CopG/Arc/MetJ family transcriptional regulator